MEDIPRAVSLLEQIQQQVKDVTDHVKNLLQRVKDQNISTQKGLGFLEVKYHLLLSYLMNLTYTILRKTEGRSIKGDASIDRLVEIRTVLEKMRPIDHKLQYQIDKLIKTAATGHVMENDPLRFQPNPDLLVSKLGDEKEDDEEEEDTKDKPKKYVPPKLVAMPYDDDIPASDKQQKTIDRARKRALNSSFMRELRDEYLDGPEEIREPRNLHRIRDDKEALHRKEFEEDHFIRIATGKKRKSTVSTNLDKLTDFSEISALTREGGHADLDESLKKRKKKPKKGKKHQRKKKRKF
ncbi:neuroguidin-like isoform X2 [Ptychodera flava]